MGIKLSDLLVKDDSGKTKTIVYDKDNGVSFDMMFLEKPELQQLIGRNTKMEFNSKTHVKEEVVDNEKLTQDILKKCVRGWHGVSLRWLSTQMVIDISTVETPDADLDFSFENLQTLVKNAYGMDSWFIDTVRNASNFSDKKVAEVKN